LPGTAKFLTHIPPSIDFFHKLKIKLDEETMVWFQALLSAPTEEKAHSLAKRLMLSRAEQKIVVQSAQAYPALLKPLSKPRITLSQIYKLLCSLRPEVQCFLLASAPASLQGRLKVFFRLVQTSKPWVRGKDLQAMGVEPGFQYSFILLEALNGQLDGKFKNRRAALKWVKEKFAE
jgi:hypothetical protein